jgi:PAS domain S-box-containing protein
MTAKKKDEANKEEGMLDPKSIEALRASNELLSLFMRHSPVYAYIKSVTPTESRILQASDDYQRMLGSSSLDIVGKTMEELFPPEFAAKMTADDWVVVTNGNVLQMEKDLDDRSYISIKFPFVQGNKNMLAGYMFDITERKHAEESLKSGEHLLKETREAEDKLRAGEDRLREAEGKLHERENKLREVDDKLQSDKDKLRAVEDKLRTGEDRLKDIEDKLREVEDKLQAGEDKLREVEDKLQADEDKLMTGEEKQQEDGKKLREGEEKLQKIEEKLRAGEDKLQETEEKLRAGEEKQREDEDKLRESEKKLQEIEDKLRDIEGKLQADEEKLPDVEGRLRDVDEKLQADREKLRKDEERLKAGEDTLRKDEERLRADREKLRKDQERLRAGGTAPASLEGIELLLREVNHQAKSNLDAVIMLLGMQQKMKGKLLGHQALTAAALSTLENRVKPMALVHEQLYQSRDASHIDSQDYLSALVSHLRTSLNVPPEIVCSVNAAGIALKPDIAVPVGMIVNELATNAFKYAFPKNQPCFGADKCEIMISLERINAEYTLIVDDNGVGLPKGFSSKSTLGLQLVKMLGVDQLVGTVKLNRTHGTRFVLKFNAK